MATRPTDTSAKVQELIDQKREAYDRPDMHAEWSEDTPVSVPAELLLDLLREHRMFHDHSVQNNSNLWKLGVALGFAAPTPDGQGEFTMDPEWLVARAAAEIRAASDLRAQQNSELPPFMAGHQPVKINPRNGNPGEMFEADDKLRQEEFFGLVRDPAGMEYLESDAVVWSDLATASAITSWLPGVKWGDIRIEEAKTYVDQSWPFDPFNTGDDDETVHRLVLDFDFPIAIRPSSTPGHYHLYIDRRMPWPRAAAFIEALEAAGLLEPGFAAASLARGYTTVRLPWVRKPHAVGGEHL